MLLSNTEFSRFLSSNYFCWPWRVHCSFLWTRHVFVDDPGQTFFSWPFQKYPQRLLLLKPLSSYSTWVSLLCILNCTILNWRCLRLLPLCTSNVCMSSFALIPYGAKLQLKQKCQNPTQKIETETFSWCIIVVCATVSLALSLLQTTSTISSVSKNAFVINILHCMTQW